MAKVSLTLDGNSSNIVHAEQHVTGRVLVDASKQIKMRGIRLELLGKGSVEWTEGGGESNAWFTGKEEYINMEVYLTGSKNNESELTLQPGVQSFPFSFFLPPELPQSFESSKGQIRYKLKAVVERVMMIDDTAELMLTVVRMLDLNQEPPHLWEPVQMQQQGSAGGPCGCCVSGFAELNTTVNRGCFTPGETIQVDGEIYNKTDSKVDNVTISFVQEKHYISKHFLTGKPGHSIKTTNVLAKEERPGFKQERDCFKNISFPVPYVTLSRLDGCSIINIRYYIEVRANFSSLSYVNTITEIVIGNVPLQRFHGPATVTSQPTPFYSGLTQEHPTPANVVGFHPESNSKDSSGRATKIPEIADIHNF